MLGLYLACINILAHCVSALIDLEINLTSVYVFKLFNCYISNYVMKLSIITHWQTKHINCLLC